MTRNAIAAPYSKANITLSANDLSAPIAIAIWSIKSLASLTALLRVSDSLSFVPNDCPIVYIRAACEVGR